MDKTLKNIAISGIVAAIFLIPHTILEFLRGAGKLTGNLLPIYIIILIISLGSYVYFIWGFKIIGEKTKNKLLVISTYLVILLTIVLYSTSFLFQDANVVANSIFAIVVVMLFGAVSIPFGIAMLRLKKEFGAVAKTVGILNIITGVSFVTVLLAFIGLLVLIPLIVLEIILMFKAAEKF